MAGTGMPQRVSHKRKTLRRRDVTGHANRQTPAKNRSARNEGSTQKNQSRPGSSVTASASPHQAILRAMDCPAAANVPAKPAAPVQQIITIKLQITIGFVFHQTNRKPVHSYVNSAVSRQARTIKHPLPIARHSAYHLATPPRTAQ